MNHNTRSTRWLDAIERWGNRLPDPVMIFVIGLVLVWIFSFAFSFVELDSVDPRTGESLEIHNLLTAEKLVDFLSRMVSIFLGFAPLGVVLVAMLGVGVAEQSGFINAVIKRLMAVTPRQLLTPSVAFVAIISHTAADAGYVLVIPLAGVVFYLMGRHPFAGVAAAFAGVSGGFSANFIPSAIDPLLQSFTQSAAHIVDPGAVVNPLNNWFFTSASCVLVIAIVWFVTDKIVEPRLGKFSGSVDIEEDSSLDARQLTALKAALVCFVLGVVALIAVLYPEGSAFRSEAGSLVSYQAPIMKAIVPLIFLLFIFPGLVYGFVSGVFASSSHVVKAMEKSMAGMSSYIVMAFFCALFIDAFSKSNMGALIAIEGAEFLKVLQLPPAVTIVGVIFLTAFVNLFVGSSSAKWALLAPIFVPMLMQLNISPDLTQVAYRVGDSSSNIITPLMPYFPLMVVYCQRYDKNAGVGTLVALMMPYALSILVLWTLFLLAYWGLGLPLGIQASYSY